MINFFDPISMIGLAVLTAIFVFNRIKTHKGNPSFELCSYQSIAILIVLIDLMFETVVGNEIDIFVLQKCIIPVTTSFVYFLVAGFLYQNPHSSPEESEAHERIKIEKRIHALKLKQKSLEDAMMELKHRTGIALRQSRTSERKILESTNNQSKEILKIQEEVDQTIIRMNQILEIVQHTSSLKERRK